jgi:hypothetical protein
MNNQETIFASFSQTWQMANAAWQQNFSQQSLQQQHASNDRNPLFYRPQQAQQVKTAIEGDRVVNFQYQVSQNGIDSFELMRLMDYAEGKRNCNPNLTGDHLGVQRSAARGQDDLILDTSSSSEVFGRRIFGSTTPNIFNGIPSPLPATSAPSNAFLFPTPVPPIEILPMEVFGRRIVSNLAPNIFHAVGTAVGAAQAASQIARDELIAQQLQRELWTHEEPPVIPSQSVPRAEAHLRYEPQRAAVVPSAAGPAEVLRVRRSSSSQIPIFGSPSAQIVDLPPHIPPMMIAQAVAQKQQCSISFDDISNENACVTTCGHIFAKDAIKEWLKQHHSCPECRKQCRINGEPRQPTAAALHSAAPVFADGRNIAVNMPPSGYDFAPHNPVFGQPSNSQHAQIHAPF